MTRVASTTLLSLAITLANNGTAQAAEPYVQGAVYVAGEVACLDGDLYEAKWWAGPDDHPTDVDMVTAAWETPWERIASATPTCTGTADAGTSAPISEPLPAADEDSPGETPEPEVPVEVESPSTTPSIPGATCPSWEPDSIYLGGTLVSHDGATWEAQWWTRGEVPGTTGPWGVWRTAPALDPGCEQASGAQPAPATESEPAESTPDPEPVSDDAPAPAGQSMLLSELLEAEMALVDSPLMTAVRQSIRTLENDAVEEVVPLRATNPENVRRVESIVGAADWDYFFPRRAPEYTYTNFLRAIAKFPAFCGAYDDGRDADAICRKALATMFAHFTQETGGHTTAWSEPEWRQGLVYVRELGWSESAPNGYGLCDPATWQGETWPCARFEAGHPAAGQFKSYFGRGAKQLSYNYNYGPFSEAMFGDVNVLLEEPNLVADTWLNLASAVFFYVYPQPPKPSMLHALDGTWTPNSHDLAGGLEPGFGVTTQIINGGIECGGATEHIQSRNRIAYYREFARELAVPIAADEVLGCAGMQRFDTSGAGAMAINWEQDWSQPNACQLVSYQTPFSAFLDGDYARCVESFFDVTVVDDLE